MMEPNEHQEVGNTNDNTMSDTYKDFENGLTENDDAVPSEELKTPISERNIFKDDNVKDTIQCEPCSFDNEDIQASAFCIICIEYICKTCLRDHKKNKMTRGHNVLVEEEMPLSKQPFELLKNIGYCKSHPEKEIEYKCLDHNEYICTVCEGRTHRKCEKVEEIHTLTKANEDLNSAESLMKKVQENIEVVNGHNQQANDNISSLKDDLENVKEELVRKTQEINDMMQNLKEKSSESAESMVVDKIDAFHGVVDKGNALINEYQQESHVMQMTINYGNPKQVHMAVQRMENTITSLGHRLDEFKGRGQLQLQFISNLKMSSLQLGSFKICDKSSKVDMATCFNDESDVGSDSLLEDGDVDISKAGTVKEVGQMNIKESDTSLKTPSSDHLPLKSLKDRTLQLVGTHNVRQSMCKEVCDIYGCVCYEDKLILIDNNNSLLVMLNHNFAFKAQTSLVAKPLGICAIDDTVVVTLQNKKVRRYRIWSNGFGFMNEFPVGLHCRGLARAGTNVAILLSDEECNTNISETDTVEVHVRNVSNGRKIKVVEQFKDSKSDRNVKMNDPRCILYTTDDHILIGEKMYLADFDENTCRTRFFKSYKDHPISGIRGLTTDNEGNIYACGYFSNNVHQISSDNFYVNRIVIPNIPDPFAIAFDAERQRLIVSCKSSDYMYEYQFTD